MESKFLRIRMELDTLGYFQNLVPQSIPLVERLLNDLKTTTESLQKYMKIAQSALKEKENLEFGAEPYKYDNAKLVKECNDLHLTHNSYKKRNEKLQSDLKQQITNLTEQNHRYIKENEKLERYICDLESEITDLGEGIINSKKPKGFTSTKIVKPILKKTRKSDAQEKKILFERSKSPRNTDFTCAMSLDSAERLLEGGENGPLKNQINYKTSDTRINKLQDEIDSLNRDKTELEQNYKEAIAKQHEAMQRAIHLAERNKELENELKDIDQMALAVEEECNTTVKDKLAKVSRLEEVLDQALRDVQSLEQANNQLKNENRKLEMDMEVLKTEKKRMQEVLENSLTEKKRLTYRVNNCAIIEHDLNMEIDRLVQESGQQRRTIAELDCALTCTKCLQGGGGDGKVAKGKAGKKGGKKGKAAAAPCDCPPLAKPCICQGTVSTACNAITPTSDRCIATETTEKEGSCTNICLKHFKQLLGQEMDNRQNTVSCSLSKVMEEKDYYMKQYHKLLEQLRKIPQESPPCSVCYRNEQIVQTLQHENKKLSEENCSLLSKLESSKMTETDLGGAKCNRHVCKRIERERDLLKADTQRLEDECDCLREKVKTISENKVKDYAKFQQRAEENEKIIRKLENERRELMQGQGSRRAMINNLEEKADMYKEMLRTANEELERYKTMYNQLKTLHEQTDSALIDTQNQLTQVEEELVNALNKDQLDQGLPSSGTCACVNAKTGDDVHFMKKQMSKLDKDKDELLNAVDLKTEKIAKMEAEMQTRDKTIAKLNKELAELEHQLGGLTDRAASTSSKLDLTDQKINQLQNQIKNLTGARDNALAENRKLQDELVALSKQASKSQNELMKMRQESDEMRQQSQQYITEVQRVEQLLSQKENQRSELLDQYRRMSKEANQLETSKQMYENEATRSKVQLSVAMDHVSDLEQRSEGLEVLVADYEKQISDLANHMAKLEMENKQIMAQQDRTEAELKTMRELCMKQGKEKDVLKMKYQDLSSSKLQGENAMSKLKCECASLKSALSDGSKNLDCAENLLCQLRRDAAQLKLSNEEAVGEIQKLKQRIHDLEEKLVTTSKQVDMYQEKALEYSQQNKLLRREVANERFVRSRAGGGDMNYPSL